MLPQIFFWEILPEKPFLSLFLKILRALRKAAEITSNCHSREGGNPVYK
jgi:hypothetical protein